MNTHKLKIATALAMLLQVPEGIADVSIGGRVEQSFSFSSSGSFTSGLSAISGDGSTIVGYADIVSLDDNTYYQSSTALTGDGSTIQMPSNYTTEEGSITFTNEYIDHTIQNDNLVFIPDGGYTITNLSINDTGSLPSVWNNNTQTQTFLLEDDNYSTLSDGSLIFDGSTLTDPSDPLYALPIQSFTDTNHDGSTIVGSSSVTSVWASSVMSTPEAFKWTEGEGITLLGDLNDGSIYSTATAVNADGTIVVGAYSLTSREDFPLTIREDAQAYWWSAKTGKISIGKLDGDSYSTAYDVSGNGQVVVGGSYEIDSLQAFKWTKADGITALGKLDGYEHSVAGSINSDVNMIVGASYNIDWELLSVGDLFNAFSSQATLWSSTTGTVGLGYLHTDSVSSWASAITPDGEVVIGASSQVIEITSPISVLAETTTYTTGTTEAFRWTEAKGMQSIGEWLSDSGYEVPSNTTLQSPIGVSDDGTVIIGNGALVTEDGVTTQIRGPWVARGDRGFISVADFTESFTTTASIPKISLSMPTMALHGAHHLPLLSQKKLSGENCAWINGDFANYHEKKADSTLVEAGFCKDLEESTRAGLGIGKSKANQTLDYSGSSEIDGKYLLLELDHQVQDSPMLLSATLLHGNWDAGINRGYLNAGTEDQSRGSTSIKATAIRARVDWRELYSLGGVTFTPKIEYTLTRSHVDGYTETTGGFPARFDPQSHTARESRIGLIIEKDLDAQTTVRGITEAVHRFDKNGANFSGEVVGLFPFSIPGSENRQDWIRLGGEIDHQIDKDSFVSFSLMRSSKGEDADVSGAVSWKGNF